MNNNTVNSDTSSMESYCCTYMNETVVDNQINTFFYKFKTPENIKAQIILSSDFYNN